MNEMKIFNNDRFGQVRVTEVNGEPLFCLADVCKAISLTNPSSVKKRLDAEDVQLLDLHALKLSEGCMIGNSKATFITESGFYDVLLFSDAPQVRPFKNWVTKEVLPSIRKTGGYIATKDNESDEDIMARALVVAHATIKRRNERIAALQGKIDSDEPKVNFANAIVGCKSSCLIGELAKVLTQSGYKIGQNRLFEWLRSHGYLGVKGERYNIPNQQYVEQGLFEIKKGVKTLSDGVMMTTTTTKVTTKGQMYFINKFVNQTDLFNNIQ